MSMRTELRGLGFESKIQSLDNFELMRAFSYLDKNSIMIMNAVPVMIADAEDSTKDVMESFSSIEDSRANFEVLVGRMLHWVASKYAWGARDNDEAKRRVQNHPAPDGESANLSDFQRRLDEQRLKFIEDFKNWHSAFQLLWLDSQLKHDDQKFMIALAMEMGFKALFTSLFGDHFQFDTVYDALIAEFREISGLAKAFVRHEKLQSDPQRATFIFHDPLISSFYFIILKCIDPSLRREAIALLKSRPRCDGVMDSALMAKIGTPQMNVEEAGSEGNYIPEHARIRGIKTTTCMVKRAGMMKYLKMASPSNREFVLHHVNFT